MALGRLSLRHGRHLGRSGVALNVPLLRPSRATPASTAGRRCCPIQQRGFAGPAMRPGSRIPLPHGSRITFGQEYEEEEPPPPAFDVQCVSTSGAPVPQVLETKNELILRAIKDARAHISVAPVRVFGEAVKDGLCHAVEVALTQNGYEVPAIISNRYAASKVHGASGPPPSVLLDVGLENVFYLDDSDSMAGPNLIEGRCVLARIAQDLGAAPTRIVKFGFQPTILSARVTGRDIGDALHKALDGWDAGSGGTYMWKMIEKDIMSKYRAGGARLRVFVLTDGMDQLSPHKYKGINGMNPMMETLQRAGFDIEFYIIVLGRVNANEERAFQKLAGATGGAFLRVGFRKQFDDAAPEAKAFLSAVASSSSTADDAAAVRRKRQLAFEKQVPESERGKWYKVLPESNAGSAARIA